MKNFLSCGILFFLLPVLLVIFWNGQKAVWGDTQTSDTPLTVLLYQNSQQNEELEALKAEAVVFRTVLQHYSAKEWHDLLQGAVKVVQEKVYIEKKKLYEEAVSQTRKIQVKKDTSDTKEIYLPFHHISAGRTRDSQDVNSRVKEENSVTDSNAVYVHGLDLVSVESSWDRTAAGFQQIFSFTEEYLLHKVFPDDATRGAAIHIQDIQTDKAGYVQYIQTESTKVSGDRIRELLGLSSSCFTIQREADRWIFTCLGVGHGYGMSLYGCEALAREGKSCQEILEYYYPQYSFVFSEENSEEKLSTAD